MGAFSQRTANRLQILKKYSSEWLRGGIWWSCLDTKVIIIIIIIIITSSVFQVPEQPKTDPDTIIILMPIFHNLSWDEMAASQQHEVDNHVILNIISLTSIFSPRLIKDMDGCFPTA